jgi:uncharacterized membrane protein YgdD (TMEM256/DUF423 family)
MLGILYKEFRSKWILISGNLFILGIVLFSGSLYALTFTVAAGRTDFNWIGVITPIGGLGFIAGWFSLLLGVIKKPELQK